MKNTVAEVILVASYFLHALWKSKTLEVVKAIIEDKGTDYL